MPRHEDKKLQLQKEVTMVRFYLDMEFTNGNYYLTDILEIAVVAKDSGNIHHSYVKINYSVPKQVQLLTRVTNRTIEAHGVPFRDVMDGLVEFIRCEATEPPIIIAHGGYVHDFPILLASYTKHSYCHFSVPAEFVYVDSMQNLKDAGYRRPGLDALCEELKIERRGHSALDDAKILQKSKEMLQNPYGYTFINIISYLNAKLPIPLQRVYGLANRCASHAELEYIVWICETKDCPKYQAGVQDCLFLLQKPFSTFVNIMIFFRKYVQHHLSIYL